MPFAASLEPLEAMEKLGHAARHRGQHVLTRSSRHRGRKTLVRHDMLPGRAEPAQERRASGSWRSVLGIASKELSVGETLMK